MVETSHNNIPLYTLSHADAPPIGVEFTGVRDGPTPAYEFEARLTRPTLRQMSESVHHPDDSGWQVAGFDGSGVTFAELTFIEMIDKPCCKDDEMRVRLRFRGIRG